jgi:hypothetical protein
MARAVSFDAEWDAEAKVWWASASGGEGITTEADTVEALRERLCIIVPDYFEAVGEPEDAFDIVLTVRMTDHVNAA